MVDVQQYLEERLQACPACGERGCANLQRAGVAHWRVRCRCGCLGPADAGLTGAAGRWNVRTRAINDRLTTLPD